MKLAELKAEVKNQKHGSDDSPEQEKLSIANSPLTYLTLHDDELNSSIVCFDNKLLPSPEQHLLFCQATNKLNMLMSAAGIIPEEREVIGVEQSPQLDDVQTACVASQIEDTKRNYQGRSSSSDLQSGERSTSDLAKEVEHLQREYSKETERASRYQAKLEALQSQVYNKRSIVYLEHDSEKLFYFLYNHTCIMKIDMIKVIVAKYGLFRSGFLSIDLYLLTDSGVQALRGIKLMWMGFSHRYLWSG